MIHPISPATRAAPEQKQDLASVEASVLCKKYHCNYYQNKIKEGEGGLSEGGRWRRGKEPPTAKPADVHKYIYDFLASRQLNNHSRRLDPGGRHSEK
jgi:hypothetical protein